MYKHYSTQFRNLLLTRDFTNVNRKKIKVKEKKKLKGNNKGKFKSNEKERKTYEENN